MSCEEVADVEMKEDEEEEQPIPDPSQESLAGPLSLCVQEKPPAVQLSSEEIKTFRPSEIPDLP